MKLILTLFLVVMVTGQVLANNTSEQPTNLISEWHAMKSKVSSAYFKAGKSWGPNLTRSDSAMRLAMFTAANAANPKYTQYLELDVKAGKANPELAAAYAAKYALNDIYQNVMAEDLDKAVMKLATDDEKVNKASEALGKAAAMAAINRARMTVADKYPDYLPQTSAGVYISGRLPAFPPAFLNTKPWFLKSRDAIRPGPPPALDSDLWVKDLNEVKLLGRKTESPRTDEQAWEADFWAGQDNEMIIDQAAERRNFDVVDTARVYAMLSMSTDDSFLAVVEAKYHYNFWRPITAIRRAELDGSDETTVDTAWEPFRNTPNHPEYPCAHCQYGGGTAAILEGTVPRMEGETFHVFDTRKPETNTTITEYSEFEKRMSDSRIYYGAHYRTSNEVGEKMGRQVAAMALKMFARPLN